MPRAYREMVESIKIETVPSILSEIRNEIRMIRKILEERME